METTLKDLIRTPSKLARELGVSRTTVMNWIELNAIPPRRVLAVAGHLDLPVMELLPFAKKATKPVENIRKRGTHDLEVLMAAYRGQPYETDLPERSIKTTLTLWGDRFPLLYDTLHALHRREITLQEAADALGVTKSTVVNLRTRYGLGPGPKKAATKPLGRYKQQAVITKPLVFDVIAGRSTVKGASEAHGIALRTLHRHISDLLRPQTVNEISHWSLSFRLALAWEIDRGAERVSAKWRKWAEDRGLVLKKRVKLPKPPENWRKVGRRRLLIAFLTDEMSLEALAAARGGDDSVLMSIFREELNMMGMDPLSMSVHHQMAVAEILVAMESHFRTGVQA